MSSIYLLNIEIVSKYINFDGTGHIPPAMERHLVGNMESMRGLVTPL